MADLNIRKRQRLAIPAHVVPGDTISVWVGGRRLIQEDIAHTATYDEAFIFDGQVEGRQMFGGGLIEAGPYPDSFTET